MEPAWRTPDELAATVGRWLLVVVPLAAVIWAGMRSWRWPVVGDAAVMHYVNLLMDRGLRPYAQITDNNMPGAYLTERWAMAIFGRGDVGWRVYDGVLLLVVGAAMVGIVGRRRWRAAVVTAALFAVMNVAAGPMFAVEREQVVVTLLLVGYACVFAGVRRRAAWMWGLGGVALGLAGTVKPTFVPLGLLLFGWVAVAVRRRGEGAWGYVGWGLAGMGAAGAVVFGWLVWWRALGAWWFVLRVITPAYAGMGHAGWRVMVEHAMAPGSAVLVGVGGVLWWLGRGERDGLTRLEGGALLLGAVWGLVSYAVQGKGFLHHRYTLEVFALLLVCAGVDGALRRSGAGWKVRAGRWVALAAVGLVCGVIVPHYVRAVDRVPERDALLEGMVGDLEAVAGTPRQMGAAGERLDGQVMCLDLVYGCLAALDRMGVRETAGFTGDLMLWEGRPSVPREFYRGWFGRVMREERPAVLLVSNEWFGRTNSFGKVEQWPEFSRELAADYVEVGERRFPEEYGAAVPWAQAPGYRVYVRRGSGFGGWTPSPPLYKLAQNLHSAWDRYSVSVAYKLCHAVCGGLLGCPGVGRQYAWDVARSRGWLRYVRQEVAWRQDTGWGGVVAPPGAR